MTNRLDELRREFEKGRQRLETLERERQELRDTMLRISGAIQVIEELLAQQVPQTPQAEVIAINT
jgi:predicted nuclease with TOPRIM domain